jgi:hypothetical protein
VLNDEVIENDDAEAKLAVLAKLAVVLKDAVVENEDVTAKLLVTEKDELNILFDPNGPNTLLLVTNDAVCAVTTYDAVLEVCAKVANDALIAFSTYDAVCAVTTNEAVEANELDTAFNT